MDFKFFKDPVPHILIDEFYTPDELKDIWLELAFLTHARKMLTPDMSGSAFTTDGNGNKIYKKKNKALFLDTLYTDRNLSNILTHSKKVWTEEFTKKCAEQHYIFNYLRTANSDTTLLSYYEDGDHYDAHNDIGAVTLLTWLYKEPKQFQGGELSFSDFNYPIELKNNRMLIFPACVNHDVSKVQMLGQVPEFGGFGRYVITNFASFNR